MLPQCFMSTEPLYTARYGLWKTPVDNSVENVENSDLSTVIPFLYGLRQAVGSSLSGLHNIRGSKVSCCITSPADTSHFLPKHSQKV